MSILKAWDNGDDLSNKNSKYSHSSEECLNTMYSRDNEKLKIWLADFLEKGRVAPLIALQRMGGEEMDGLASFIRTLLHDHAEKGHETVERIKTQTALLIKETDGKEMYDEAQIRYLFNLSELAIQLDAQNAWDVFLEKLKDRKYKGENFWHLYQQLYSAVFFLSKNKEKIKNIFEEDIFDPSYTLLAYLCLCKIDKNNCITYLHDFITTRQKRKHRDINHDMAWVLSSVPEIRETLSIKMDDPAFTNQFEMVNVLAIESALKSTEEKHTKIEVIKKITSALYNNAQKREKK